MRVALLRPSPISFKALTPNQKRHLIWLVLTIVVLMLLGLGLAERVRALGAADYFLKPVNESQLVDAIRAAIGHPTLPIVPSDNPRPKQ